MSAIESGEGVDWATGEALAFGTLLTEGHPVRLSGQDCRRGSSLSVRATNRNARPVIGPGLEANTGTAFKRTPSAERMRNRGA